VVLAEARQRIGEDLLALLSAYNRVRASSAAAFRHDRQWCALARFARPPFENVKIHQDSIRRYLYNACRCRTLHNIGGNNASKPQFSMPVFGL
jgi:hypothetical protein